MKEQIEEKHALSESIYMSGHGLDWKDSDDIAEQLYNAGYRKQKEGEWIKHEESIWEHRYWCSVCNFYRIGAPTPHCQNCGAHMKG